MIQVTKHSESDTVSFPASRIEYNRKSVWRKALDSDESGRLGTDMAQRLGCSNGKQIGLENISCKAMQALGLIWYDSFCHILYWVNIHKCIFFLFFTHITNIWICVLFYYIKWMKTRSNTNQFLLIPNPPLLLPWPFIELRFVHSDTLLKCSH